MFAACEYDATGTILEARSGRCARTFLRAYAGTNSLRISEPDDEFPDLEVGEVYPAGYNIDGTPPTRRQRFEDLVAYAVSRFSPAQARTYVVRRMKRQALKALEIYRQATDADFGDPEIANEGLALRDRLRTIVQAAAAATSEEELRAAWRALCDEIGGA